ncbi:hypothetical protein FRC04_000164 [Tulasnella sp. 424]|nr:hypothetical protein FRC04_000164 [Tulasnella sp. 424]KAG8982028.1 hypothetical protein FRC05_000170 [Tulasnella sp. 425]
MNSNQLPLIPDIYHVGCLPGVDKEVTLYLDHANVDQPVLAKTGVEDLPAQEWVFTWKPDSSALFSIYNIQSGQYLGVDGGKVKALSTLFWWTLVRDDMYYSIVSGDLSLKMQGGGDGAQVVLESASTNTQRWTVIPTAGGKYGPYWLKHKEAQNYLALQGGSYADKTHAQGFKGTPERKADPSFQWRLIPTGPNGSNLVRIQNVCSSTCLMRHGGPVAGAVQISGWSKPDHKWVSKQAPGEPNARIFQVEGSNYVTELYAGSAKDGNDVS